MTTLDVLEELAPVPPLADVPFGPTPPTPPTDGLRPAVRAMVAELAEHFKGADPGSVAKAAEAMKTVSANPRSWGSQDQAGKAVKAYRANIGVQPDKKAAKKPVVRTATPAPRRPVVRPTDPVPVRPVVQTAPVPQPTHAVHAQPIPTPAPVVRTKVRSWPVMVIALPAMVAIWSGWVGLGGLTGFGMVHPLPGIADGFSINSAITLPIGVEAYGAYALRTWLTGHASGPARRFAKWSAIGSLLVGAAGQVAYHVLVAYGITAAPWWITTVVACMPVAVLGMAAALAHLIHAEVTQ